MDKQAFNPPFLNLREIQLLADLEAAMLRALLQPLWVETPRLVKPETRH